ncbi:tautomerase family protein [Oxalobacteraceae bacterium]|nr:tautomerase family protein [Oxalobacteraceae bacterium]
MPMSRISLLKGKSPEYLRALSDGLDRALVETFDVPATDKFQIFHQLDANELVFDRHYLGGPRSDDFVIITIAIAKPRSTDTKQAFYRHLAAILAESPGLRPEDLMVIISASQPDEWSFSGGKMNPAAQTG